MLSILLYCVGVMYTPGPVNIVSLNNGMQNRLAAHLPFCLGVGAALCFWFTLIGFTGGAVIGNDLMPYIAAAGTCFILYLAHKIITSEVGNVKGETGIRRLTFRDGLLMQLLNPKSFLAVLPVTTVQFPAAGIEGGMIAVWAVGLSMLGFGAPLAYALFGSTVSARIQSARFLRAVNILMGLLLVAVAAEMAYDHVFLALR